MDLLHKFILAGEITGSAITGLIALSALIGFIRLKVSGPAAPFVPSIDIPKAEAQSATETWPHRMLVAFDIAVNVIVLRGQQDETISARVGRAKAEGHLWGKLMSAWLDGFQSNHCVKAACGDLQRAKSRVQVLQKFLGL